MNTIQGVFIIGKCMGFVSEPWQRGGRSGVNNKIGVARTYEDKWGNTMTEIMQIDVPAKAVNKFREQAEMMKGTQVMIRVAPIAKQGGRSGAFLTYFAPEDSNLIPYVEAKPVE